MRDMCIVDEAGRYVDCALADGSGELQYRALRDGERAVEALAPIFKGNAGTAGFVSPVWNGFAWAEGAAAEEIAAFDAAHPAPVLQKTDAERIARLEDELMAAKILLGVE